MVLNKEPPKFIYDDNGHLVKVILTAEDFVAYLHVVAAEEDWETLPEYLQNAVDRMLIDEVRTEKDTALDLETVLGGAVEEE